MSPDCAPWSVAANEVNAEKRLQDRLRDQLSLQFCQDIAERQDYYDRGFGVEQLYASAMWQTLPENPLRLHKIPGNRSRQRVGQCMHGAVDEIGHPIQKPTGFGSNVKLKCTALRCSHEFGHSRLQGTGPSGLARTATAAVYPKTMCNRLHQDIIRFLNARDLLKLKPWPQQFHSSTLTHYYDCVRCQLGRMAPSNVPHTMVPGQCRHGRWALKRIWLSWIQWHVGSMTL